MTELILWDNQLTGTSILYSSCPFLYTSQPWLTKRAIKYFAGRIPTELGRCSFMSKLQLWGNKLTGTPCAHSAPLGTRVYRNLKRSSCCAGTIPTELGWCTAMAQLVLYTNQLTGPHFFAHIDQLVYESTLG
jgi:hypothetical protein